MDRAPKVARSAQRQFSLFPVAHQELEQLAELAGETAIPTVLDADKKHPLCIDQVECQQSRKVISEIGRAIPLHAGASGKILGAYLPPSDFEARVSGRLERYTKDTTTDPDVLRKQFVQIRAVG